MMDVVSLEMNNLVYTEVKTVPDNFLTLVSQSEELLFEDGYYKNGPTLIEVKPTEFEQEEQRCCLPCNKCLPLKRYLDQDTSRVKSGFDSFRPYKTLLLVVWIGLTNRV